MYHIWSVLDFLPSFFSIVRRSSGSWQFMSSKRLPFEIWSNQVFFSKYVFTNSSIIFHTYYTISNKTFIWGISYQVSFSFHRAEQVIFHKKFHFWTIAKQRFLSYDDDEDEIGCGQWPSPAKPILFLHPSHYIWPQRSLFLRRVIPDAKPRSIRGNICRKYFQLENNLSPTKYWSFINTKLSVATGPWCMSGPLH